MCGPAALLIAGTAVSMIGTGMSALQANKQARYEARVASRNADMEREAAQQAMQNTREASLAHYRKVAQIKGAQRARAAAAGVQLDFGTAADLVDETDALGREDAGRILKQGEQAVRGHDVQTANYMGQKSAAKTRASNALVNGAIGMASTALGGAQQYAKMKG